MSKIKGDPITKIMNEYSKLKVVCKHCGHKIVIPKFKDKMVCSWCGYYVYRTPQIEFKEKIRRKIDG